MAAKVKVKAKELVEWTLLVLVAALTWGCGGGSTGGSGTVAVFPSRERLQEITSQPPPASKQQGGPTVAVNSWELAPADATAANPLLGRGSAKLRPSLELGCAAREMARFLVQQGGMPDEHLQHHLLGQCGATTVEPSLQYWSVDLTGPASDQELLAGLRAPLGKALASSQDEPTDVGSAFVRDSRRAVFVLISAKRVIEIEPIQPVGADGTVVITGRLLTRGTGLHGLVTQGEFGVGQCANDRTLKLPRFRVTCQLAQDDASAWIELRIRPPERLLLRGVLRYRARRNAELEPFSVPEPDPSASAAPGQDFRQRLAAAINAVRAKAGLGPLQFAERQSRAHEKLAPYFFAGGDDEEFLDDIALGLMAGWEVPGIIRDGSFYGAALSGTLSVERWLGHLLQYPGARTLVFDPSARVLAVGPLIDEKHASIGALLSTYSFYESDNHDQERQWLIERIARLRQARGTAPARATQDPELGEAARRVRKGAEVETALNDALSAISNRDRKSVQAMVLETLSLGDLVLPPELATRPRLEYAVEVTHTRRGGAAWGNLVIMIVISEPTTTTASLAAPGRG